MKTPSVEYIDNVGNLSCIDVNTNKTLWQIPIRGPVRKWPVLLSPEIMVFAAGPHTNSVVVINPSLGRILWQTPEDVVSNFAVAEGAVYSVTGRIVWRRRAGINGGPPT